MNLESEPVLILHNMPPAGDSGQSSWMESDASVFEEVAAVSAALTAMGVPHRTAGAVKFTDVPNILAVSSEKIVFNLAEEFRDQPMSASYVPALCRAYGKWCTGNETPCLVYSLDKWRTKVLMQSAGLPHPAAILVKPGESVENVTWPAKKVIVKPVCADASEGISPASVIEENPKALHDAVRLIHRQFGQAALVEEYIDGRELNVSVLQEGKHVRVLAVAEIDFSAFEPERPRIVDYAAKWLPATFEYQHTPRIIPAPLTEAQSEALRKCAVDAWHVVGCNDYARVDFRLTAKGHPMVLEVNANPDISPGGGFAAALEAAKVSYEHFVKVVLENCHKRMAMRPVKETAAPAPEGPRPKIVVRRTELRDREPILGLLAATKLFRPEEMDIAREVLDAAIADGATGHYQSYTADEGGEAVGWVCFGPTPCTVNTYDIYWLAVVPKSHRRGLGATLIRHSEALIRARQGRLLVVETSSRSSYESARRFYEKMGYQESGRIKHFYAPGDDRVIYTKPVEPEAPAEG